MALNRGKLFAGALFAGALFVQSVDEPGPIDVVQGVADVAQGSMPVGGGPRHAVSHQETSGETYARRYADGTWRKSGKIRYASYDPPAAAKNVVKRGDTQVAAKRGSAAVSMAAATMEPPVLLVSGEADEDELAMLAMIIGELV
jgi:hypothetical protein